MRLGVVLPQTEIGPNPVVIAKFAKTAEEGGFEFLTAFDHVLGADASGRPDWQGPYTSEHQFHEIFVLFGYLASITQMELCTGVLVLPQRLTALVAKQAAQVDILTGGNFRLGIGTGWNSVEYEALGVDFRTRGERYEEQIVLLRELWTNDVVTFQGRFHTVDRAGLAPRPVRRPIPLWLGGAGPPLAGLAPAAPRVLDRIGRLADGWLTNIRPGRELDQALATVRRSAERAGRDPAEIGLQGTATTGRDIEPDSLRRQLDAWERANATHVAVSTLRSGRSAMEHVDAISRIGQIIRTFLEQAP
jgi:probable F420-dependent oxidoreductase